LSLQIEILSNYIAPIFIASGLGAVFSRVFKPDIKPMARLAFYVLSPCLVFSALTTTAVPVAEILRLAGFTIAVVGTAGGLAWGIGRMLKMSGSLIAALMLSCMFVNAGNYGLALNLFAFGEDAMASALIFYMVSTMLVFSLGVVVASHGKAGGRTALVGMLEGACTVRASAGGFDTRTRVTYPAIRAAPGVTSSSGLHPDNVAYIRDAYRAC
jgi:predicted permease